MIGYVTLGTNDLERAARYYDALLGEIGARRVMDFGTFIAWGNDPKTPMRTTRRWPLSATASWSR
jgi:catechol 2,3-dioxygenase-like lactoylglutathione lyase family enzyme